ncbi:MAG: hypothetical protein F6K00_14260 [Leptolyngbya sp. SIOISBB]|nr:hypothetical protein [Leptolyngbya sp. SIOISBB]
MNNTMNFLECCILPLSDGTYQLRHLSGAVWNSSDLQSCLKAAAKAWIMSRPHPAVVIQPGGWCLGNRAATVANWPYCSLGLLPGQVYKRFAKQTALQGEWEACSFQKVLINDRDFLLLESTHSATSKQGSVWPEH